MGIHSINDILQNFNSTLEFIGAIANGEISLDDLKAMGIDSVVGDIKCVANNWNIVSDKKKYSNAVISDFGSHLAGAYEEIVSLGYAVYGLAKFAKGLASKIKGAIKLSGKWTTVNESMSDASRAYQRQITGTDEVWLQNGVKYDGMSNGTLVEVKGSYANFVDKNTGTFKSWFSGKQGLNRSS